MFFKCECIGSCEIGDRKSDDTNKDRLSYLPIAVRIAVLINETTNTTKNNILDDNNNKQH